MHAFLGMGLLNASMMREFLLVTQAFAGIRTGSPDLSNLFTFPTWGQGLPTEVPDLGTGVLMGFM